MTTSSGTQGIVNAGNADEIMVASFVNVKATIDYIKDKNPEIVTLVAIGSFGIEIRDEDGLCAKYIKESLEGKSPDFNKMRRYLRDYESSQKFFDEHKPEFPKEDFDCAMDIDRFDFALKVVKKGNAFEIIKA